MNLLNLVQQYMTDNVMESLNAQMPQAKPQETQNATQVVMSTLINALAKNASSDNGLQGLMSALNNNHNGGILENLAQVVGGATPQDKSTDGVGILSHLFGGNIFNIVELVSKSSGLNRNNSMNMLVKLAPVALGVLGQMQRSNNMQPQQLRQTLQQTVQEERAQNAETSIIEKLLDRNGDGDIKGEIAQIGMSLLGRMFKR